MIEMHGGTRAGRFVSLALPHRHSRRYSNGTMTKRTELSTRFAKRRRDRWQSVDETGDLGMCTRSFRVGSNRATAYQVTHEAVHVSQIRPRPERTTARKIGVNTGIDPYMTNKNQHLPQSIRQSVPRLSTLAWLDLPSTSPRPTVVCAQEVCANA